MDLKSLEKNLMDKTISVADLSGIEVELLIDQVKADIQQKQKELDELNLKIKNVKKEIDNWGN